jgi:ribosomal protein L37AE/L43A
MKYNFFYRNTKSGIEYIQYKMNSHEHLDVCQNCGNKKIIVDNNYPPIWKCNICDKIR